MSAEVLKAVLEATKKTPINVANDTNLTVGTVYNYLRGDRVHRSTEAALERWVKEHSKETDGPEAA